MCYEERLFRSWATKKAQKREKNLPMTERDRSRLTPIRAAPTPDTKRRKEVEREFEEIV
jgi:hypothetical protein